MKYIIAITFALGVVVLPKTMYKKLYVARFDECVENRYEDINDIYECTCDSTTIKVLEFLAGEDCSLVGH